MKIPLEKFCVDADDFRRELGSPFRIGEFDYATDGKLIVRVDHLDAEPKPKAPNAEFLFAGFCSPSKHEWIEIPDIPKPETKTSKCKCCDQDVIEQFDNPKGMMIGRQLIAKHFLRKIKEILPNPKIKLADTDLDPIKIAFDGGIGLLVPMRDDK